MEVNNIENIQANVQLQSRINRVRLEFPDYINDYFDSLQNKNN